MLWVHPEEDTCFHFLDQGAGMPLVFQHGLGGSVQQADELFGEADGIRLVSMDCRGHGKTGSAVDKPLTLDLLADDFSRFIDQIFGESVFVGGLSLGALLALRVAITNPQTIRGVILLRPAWPEKNCSTDFDSIRLSINPIFCNILSEASEIPLSELSKMKHPALVMGMPGDPIHPDVFASDVARSLPNGVYKEVPNNRENRGAYKDRVLEYVLEFLDAA